MGRFDITPEVAAEYRHKFRDAVQPHVDEEVLAVGTFRTTGSGTKYAISKTQAGALAYGAAGLIGRGGSGPEACRASSCSRSRRSASRRRPA